MASPYVHERQSEYWTSRQIEEFYLDAGFEITVFPLSQYNEKVVPTDFIFFDRQHSKLFGFQYKAMYHEGKQDFWQIEESQHKNLAQYPWIYYSLSELKRASESRAALHQLRILETNFPYQKRLYPKGKDKITYYNRWAAFYDGLEQCRNGVLVHSVQELTQRLKPKENVELSWELTRSLVDIFVADFVSKHAVHLSPFLRE